MPDRSDAATKLTTSKVSLLDKLILSAFALMLSIGSLWGLIYFAPLVVAAAQSLVSGKVIFAGEVFTWSMATFCCGTLAAFSICLLIDQYRNEPDAHDENHVDLTKPWLARESWETGKIQNTQSTFLLMWMAATVVVFAPYVCVACRNALSRQADTRPAYVAVPTVFLIA